MCQHTPGPWVVSEYSSGMICVDGLDGKSLCAVGYNRTDGRDDIANAHLIAAAPAMYEALQTLVEYLSAQVPADTLDDWKHVFAARQALAQAEGKG